MPETQPQDGPKPTPATDAPTVNVVLARQPIFDLRGGLFAYELLYRKSLEATAASGASDDVMSAEVLVNAFLSIGIEQLAGNAIAFVNCTRATLVEGTCRLLPPKRVVLEILERVEPDDEVVAAVKGLVQAGYRIALDDFEYRPEYEPLLALASIVKIDVLNRPMAEVDASLEKVRPHAAKLLAERVESHEVRDACAALGFVYFQGYFFQVPEVVGQRELAVPQVTLLRLLNLLRDPDSADDQLEQAFRGDMALTYRLLRTVNSAAIGGRGVESIRHAVKLVGRAELQKWLSLLFITSVVGRGGVQSELVRIALARARMSERLAVATKKRAVADEMFLVGLFSVVDALLETSMETLLARIDLAPDAKAALLTRSGPLAGMLSLVEEYERGAWDRLTSRLSEMGLPGDLLPPLYAESLAWSQSILDQSRS